QHRPGAGPAGHLPLHRDGPPAVHLHGPRAARRRRPGDALRRPRRGRPAGALPGRPPPGSPVTKPERVQAALERAQVDRVPYAFWRHFPDADHSPRALAEATLAFHARWGSDFIKLTPAGGYAVREWGCVESAEVSADGHRPCATCAVRSPADWAKIRPLDPAAAHGYAQQVETLIRMGGDGRVDCAILPTLFSPLSVARKLSGDRLAADLREHPEAVEAALEAITETLTRSASLGLDQGAGGTPEQARAETRDAIAQTGGIGLIVGPGCVVPPAASPANLAAVVTTVGGR